MNYVADIISECESKLNGIWIKHNKSVKYTESVHKIYLFRFGFRLGPNSIRVLCTWIFRSFK